jgi:hypothetical protein
MIERPAVLPLAKESVMAPIHAKIKIPGGTDTRNRIQSARALLSSNHIETLCLAMGRAQESLSRWRTMAAADRKDLGDAVNDWENEGGSQR